MKHNLPVTQHEVLLKDDQVIVTKTDIKGQIAYANEDFCEISGFTILELLGQSHNIVRHPDMPPEAFRDLWDTLKQGYPWRGIVKNRCKNGDFYWVKAYVAPIHDNQVVVGYLSSRKKPSPEEVTRAEALYRDLNSKHPKYRLHRGEAVPRRLLARLSPFAWVTGLRVASQQWVMIAGFALAFLTASLWAYAVLEEVKVNGPKYQRIVQGKDLIADVLPPPEYLVEAWLIALEMQHASSNDMADLLRRSEVLRADFETRHDYWTTELEPGPLKQALVEDAYKPGIEFLNLRDQHYIPAIKAGNLAEATTWLPRMRERYEAHRKAIDEVVSLATARNQTDEASARDFIQRHTLGLLAVALLGLITIGGLGIFIARTLTRQLGGEPGYAAELVEHIAAGNIGIYVKHTKRGSNLLSSIQLMQNTLQETIGRIQNGAESVANVAKELAGSASDVRQASTQQSESAGNIARAGEAMSHNISLVAGNAQAARAVTLKAGEASEAGAAIIEETIQGLERIALSVQQSAAAVEKLSSQSEQIASVAAVIREIAGQTNLLALNAAIEAARAGEHGRGFSVVADEVRKLAERTRLATQEIGAVIEDIQANMTQTSASMQAGVELVNHGVALAGEAGRSMGNIETSARQVVQAVTEISQAMQEQSQSGQEVAANIENIARMSSSSSEAANASSQAAQNLSVAANELARAIHRFAI